MDILRHIERDLNSHYHDNIIYQLNENETDTYEQIKKLIKEDYGYLDIVVSFEDYEKLNALFKQLSNKNKHLKHTINSDYINYCILKGADIETIGSDVSVSRIGKNLFGGDIFKYMNCDSLLFDFDVSEQIKKKAQTTKNKKCRIHFLLDNVLNVDLQKCINDFIAYRCDIAMMCYTTKDLLTTYTTNNNIIENVHDYIRIESDEKNKVLKRKWEENII